MIQALLPGMIGQGKGHIVALCSIAGMSGLPNLVPYCSTKFAVRGYMEALTEELRHTSPVSIDIFVLIIFIPFIKYFL